MVRLVNSQIAQWLTLWSRHSLHQFLWWRKPDHQREIILQMIIRDLTKAKDRWYTLQYDHLQLGEYTIKHSPRPSSVRSTGVNRINREHQLSELCSISRDGQDWKGSIENTFDAHFFKLVTETLTQEEKRLQIHQFAKMRIVQYFKRWFPMAVSVSDGAGSRCLQIISNQNVRANVKSESESEMLMPSDIQ